jgi:hypothetical protein
VFKQNCIGIGSKAIKCSKEEKVQRFQKQHHLFIDAYIHHYNIAPISLLLWKNDIGILGIIKIL